MKTISIILIYLLQVNLGLKAESRNLLLADFKYFTIKIKNREISFPGELRFNDTEGLTGFCFYYKRGFYEYEYRNNFCNFLKNGKILNSDRYLEIYSFSEGLGLVLGENLKYGFINIDGNYVIPPIYSKASSFSEGLAIVQIEDKIYYIDKNGNNKITLPYGRASSFSEGLAVYEKNGYYGYIDKRGKLVIPHKFGSIIEEPGASQYEYIYPVSPKMEFKNGLAIVNNPQVGKFQIINKKGNVVFESLGDNLYRDYKNNSIFFEYIEGIKNYYRIENNRFVTKLDKYVSEDDVQTDQLPNYIVDVYINKFGNIEYDTKRVINFNEKINLSNKNNKIIFPIKFHDSESVEQTKYGFIDSNGFPHFTKEYQFLGDPQDGLILFKKENRYGYLDLEGKKIIDNVFEDATDFSDGYASVKSKGKWGVIQKSGKFVINPTYQDLTIFSEGLAGVRENNKWGFINPSGKIIIIPQYKEVGLAKDGRIPVSKNKLFGYIDYKNNLILPYKFLSPNPFAGGLLENSYELRSSYKIKDFEKLKEFYIDEYFWKCAYTRTGKKLNGCFNSQ